ncbi:glucokinase [Pelagirhabdus alkalitolerans]|uniref:Glucokinase n=1 Tax=Pelagirhabdus alkalitolerans TaxID=1612202 RepID=A0A1G6LHP7_9BACI|nr:ROK family protein [Pelagirhabdus alkalitolerans]SDC42126.1 glucokinase [Pelagirhabdus alkalitolerans]
MKKILGIDIGGTKIAIAIIDGRGHVIIQDTIKMNQTLPPSQVFEQMKGCIEDLLRNIEMQTFDLFGIGIGAPGPINNVEGTITNPPNLKKWRGVPIVEWVKTYFGLPVYFDNDANAAALAEKWIGDGQNHQDFVYLTISTGIGAGIVSNDQLLTGSRGNAGDFGHTVIDPSYGKCMCGQEGCLEHIASGTAIAKAISELKERNVSTQEAFAYYRNGDPKVVHYLDGVLRILGIAVVNIINMFEPEVVIIGGGVSQSGDVLLSPIRSYVSKYALNKESRSTPIINSSLKNNTGVIGAAALVLQEDLKRN